ncbi:protein CHLORORESPIRATORY REDUCTION 7, chloroplastic [Cucurbita pepo subsp. pepo]|uniref:protein CHLORORESPIRATORY REDUCTION 7, chloroplastic n=1 Tax=Cucurbita pepo subsp. pepo TaxID=3664 RepID=UPI000C9D88A8|nr:protein CHLORORESPIRATORY REDUCTION 7, chloroplastic [Cucurbita pepo subsp. pepo]
MERAALHKHFQSFNGIISYSNSTLYPLRRRRTEQQNSKCLSGASSFLLPKLPTASKHQQRIKVYASSRRRRRANESSDTYVLLEPGEDEKFVSKEELEAILKGWLQNWPGEALPPDLQRFESIEEAVSFLVKFVCELEIDGDIGSIQWYQVRLE